MPNAPSSPSSSPGDKAPSPARSNAKPVTKRRGIPGLSNSLNFAVIGLFILAATYALYLSRPVLLPFILALLVTLLLKPVQRVLEKRLRLPSPASASFVLLIATGAIGLAVFTLSTPAAEYAGQLREEIVKNRLQEVFEPLTKLHARLTDMADQVDDLTSADGPEEKPGNPPDGQNVVTAANSSPPDADEPQPNAPPGSGSDSEPAAENPPAVKVEIRKSPVDVLYDYVMDFSLHFFLTFALVYFFLAYGDRIIRRLGEVKAAAGLVEKISTDISHYLLTITAINIGLGVAIAITFRILGMPNAILWGVMGALFNYVPYLGAIGGAIIVFLVASINFDHTAQIIAVPAAYYILTAVEGNFITPAIIGRHFTINPIIVFVWLLSWGALWGVPGMLIALPLLMVFRIICSTLPGLKQVERILSA